MSVASAVSAIVSRSSGDTSAEAEIVVTRR